MLVAIPIISLAISIIGGPAVSVGVLAPDEGWWPVSLEELGQHTLRTPSGWRIGGLS